MYYASLRCAMHPKNIQVKISSQKVPEGSLMYSTVLNTTNPFTNLPKTHIAKSIPREEHPKAGSKQSIFKQSLL